MRKKLNRLNRIAAVCATLSAVLLFVTISFAAYTSLSSVKRVVTVKGTEQLFSSNILLPYTDENELQTRIVTFAENSDKKMLEIDIANYLQGDTTKYDSQGISYSLQVELIDVYGNQITNSEVYAAYRVNDSSMNQNPYILNGNLMGNAALKNTYTVEVPADYLTAYKLKVTAIPEDSRYSSIGRIIAASTESYTPHWVGEYLDSEQEVVTKNQALGIINYRLSGHMEEYCTLSWNTERVEIDPWTLTDMGISENAITVMGNRKSIQLHLGLPNTPDQYNIKFYRTLSAKDAKETWSEISNAETGYITFKNSETGK